MSEKELSKLTPIVEYLKENSDVMIELIGYADNTGSVSYNLQISEKRVNEVARLLQEDYGIDPDRIDMNNGGMIIRGRTKGYVENDRRVEIRILY